MAHYEPVVIKYDLEEGEKMENVEITIEGFEGDIDLFISEVTALILALRMNYKRIKCEIRKT